MNELVRAILAHPTLQRERPKALVNMAGKLAAAGLHSAYLQQGLSACLQLAQRKQEEQQEKGDRSNKGALNEACFCDLPRYCVCACLRVYCRLAAL